MSAVLLTLKPICRRQGFYLQLPRRRSRLLGRALLERQRVPESRLPRRTGELQLCRRAGTAIRKLLVHARLPSRTHGAVVPARNCIPTLRAHHQWALSSDRRAHHHHPELHQHHNLLHHRRQQHTDALEGTAAGPVAAYVLR